MRPEIRDRLLREEEALGGRANRPADLLLRTPRGTDFIDSAVIGGASLADIVSGKLSEARIPADVKHAFNLQFPSLHEGFAHAVQRLSGNDAQLQGLVNGVKGKLFEIKYVDWLNHGHLPAGYVAELAQSATNPAWDILIHDSAGRVADALQLKAAQSISYVEHAISLHPNIDVVIPHDIFAQIADKPQLLGHVIDGGHSLTSLNAIVAHSVAHAEAADIHFHFPIIGIAFILGTTYMQYRQANMKLESALQKAGERSILSLVSTAVAWASGAAMHEPMVGLPVGIATRLLLGRWLDKKKLRNVLDHKLTVIRRSVASLELATNQPRLLLGN